MKSLLVIAFLLGIVSYAFPSQNRSTHFVCYPSDIQHSAIYLDTSHLQPVYEAYFGLKDALVKSDVKEAAAKGSSLITSLKAVELTLLSQGEHNQWTKIQSALIADAQKISTAKELEQQRDYFITLSSNMYLLMKSSDLETPVYWQHCPMANDGKGADWLSKEIGIKNPYYGSMMLTCGKTVETLK
jgi:hypothetical protein